MGRDNRAMSCFWMLSDGRDPARIGFGLPAELANRCPGFAWVGAPRCIEGQLYLGLFRAPDLSRAEVAGLLVALLGDTSTRVWAADAEAA